MFTWNVCIKCSNLYYIRSTEVNEVKLVLLMVNYFRNSSWKFGEEVHRNNNAFCTVGSFLLAHPVEQVSAVADGRAWHTASLEPRSTQSWTLSGPVNPVNSCIFVAVLYFPVFRLWSCIFLYIYLSLFSVAFVHLLWKYNVYSPLKDIRSSWFLSTVAECGMLGNT